MIAWLEGLPIFWTGVVVIGGFVSSTLIMGYLVGALTPLEIREAHNDRAGFILAVIGVIYAVLLAFIAIGVWQRFQDAQARNFEEAGSLGAIYRGSESFPSGANVRASLRDYVLSVTTDEWPAMHQGKKSLRSEALINTVDREIRALPVTTWQLQNVQAEMLSAMDAALMDRQTRLTWDLRGINGVLWIVLIAGGYLTVAFTYLFGFDRTIMQQLMIGGLSLMIGLVLYLIVALDFPYRGGITVQPDAFRALLDTFSSIRS